MRDPNRIDGVLQLLAQVWRRSPDMRLGQIVDNARVQSGFAGDTFNVEDDDIEIGLRQLARLQGAVERLSR